MHASAALAPGADNHPLSSDGHCGGSSLRAYMKVPPTLAFHPLGKEFVPERAFFSHQSWTPIIWVPICCSDQPVIRVTCECYWDTHFDPQCRDLDSICRWGLYIRTWGEVKAFSLPAIGTSGCATSAESEKKKKTPTTKTQPFSLRHVGSDADHPYILQPECRVSGGNEHSPPSRVVTGRRVKSSLLKY